MNLQSTWIISTILLWSTGCSSRELVLPAKSRSTRSEVQMPSGPPGLRATGDLSGSEIARPTPGDCSVRLVVTEIHMNPRRVPDRYGEFFEVFNPSEHSIDLRGWQIGDGDREQHIVVAPEPLLVPAGGFLVFGVNRDSELNGGVVVAYQYSDIRLSNETDRLVLRDPCGAVAVDLRYPMRGWARPKPGYAMEMASRPGKKPVRWKRARARLPSGDRASPGTAPWAPRVSKRRAAR